MNKNNYYLKNASIKKMEEIRDIFIKEHLTDLLLFIMAMTGWEESSRSDESKILCRSWKGYPFRKINELANEYLIDFTPNKQPLIFTKKGYEKAIKVYEKYFANNKDNKK